MYSTATLGFYSLVNRILGMPATLIGQAFGQVFFQKASEERNKTGNAYIAYTSTLKKLLIIATPIYFILYFVVEDLIAFVFSEEWRITGVYAKILMPLFFIRFVTVPLSRLYACLKKTSFYCFYKVWY